MNFKRLVGILFPQNQALRFANVSLHSGKAWPVSKRKRNRDVSQDTTWVDPALASTDWTSRSYNNFSCRGKHHPISVNSKMTLGVSGARTSALSAVPAFLTEESSSSAVRCCFPLCWANIRQTPFQWLCKTFPSQIIGFSVRRILVWVLCW